MKIKFIFYMLIITLTWKFSAVHKGTYYTNWAQYRPGAGKFTPNNLLPIVPKLSEINYAFAFFNYNTQTKSVTNDWKIYFTEWNDPASVTTIVGYKNDNPNLKILLSVGGWSFNDPTGTYGPTTMTFFSQMIADPNKYQAFTSSAIEICKQYNLDGIDLDWEFPGVVSRGGTAEDYENFANFLNYFSNQLSQNHLLVTAAVPAIAPFGYVSGNYDNGTKTVDSTNGQTYFNWLCFISQYFSWYNVMCYDYYGAGFSTVTNDNAPLYSLTTSSYSVQTTLQSYLTGGMDKNKIIIGVPSYGRTYAGVTFPSPYADAPYGPGCNYTSAGAAGYYTQQAGILAYYEIIGDFQINYYIGIANNSITQTGYTWNTNLGGLWSSVCTPSTSANKGLWILQNNLAGGFIYAADLDNFQDAISPYAISNALYDALQTT